MSDVPNKNTFASLYSGQPPWDIGKPQKTLIVVVCFRHHREDTILVT